MSVGVSLCASIPPTGSLPYLKKKSATSLVSVVARCNGGERRTKALASTEQKVGYITGAKTSLHGNLLLHKFMKKHVLHVDCIDVHTARTL